MEGRTDILRTRARDRLREVLSLLLGPRRLPVATGTGAACLLIATETLLGFPLQRVATIESLDMLYLLGVLTVSTVWGFLLGAVTAFFSVAAMDFFHMQPPHTLFIFDSTKELMTLVVYVAVALLISAIAGLARSRAAEADERRREADLAAELAHLLLRTRDLRSALPMVSKRLAQRLRLRFADIELAATRGDERRTALPLHDEATSLGTLLVPASLPEPVLRRLQDRVVPSLTALLHAARERECIAHALRANRDELAASRARIVVAADESRRRIERDLHDGVQQRLVSLQLKLRVAEAMVPAGLEMLRAQLSETARDQEEVVEDLQELSRGLHPPILAKGGLAPALRALTRRFTLPVELNVHLDQRLPERIEVTTYYIVSEALTNVAKHAHASLVHIDIEKKDATLRLCVHDDGIGGADPARGSGLIGLTDRVAVVGGTIQIASPPGSGTSMLVRIPTGNSEQRRGSHDVEEAPSQFRRE